MLSNQLREVTSHCTCQWGPWKQRRVLSLVTYQVDFLHSHWQFEHKIPSLAPAIFVECSPVALRSLEMRPAKDPVEVY